MKKLLAFILLLSHLNSSMFFPVMEEQDCYNAKGEEVDDISSVVEYIDEILLGNEDDMPEDEESNESNYFPVLKFFAYNFEQQKIQTEPLDTKNGRSKHFPVLKEVKITSPVFDIPYPPPEV